MDGDHAIWSIFIILNFIFGHCMNQEVLSIGEGNTAILTCSENNTKPIWYISWTIKPIIDSRIAITKCYTVNKLNGRSCITEETFSESLKHHYKEATFIQENAFTSQLTIYNVTADLRQADIECVKGDKLNRNTNEIWIMSSYTLKVHHLPDVGQCSATKDINNVIKVSCQGLRVYPEITCRIFPEFENKIPELESDEQGFKLKEIPTVITSNHRLNGSVEYYHADCTALYHPIQNGIFRFRVQIYFTENSENSVLNISTNSASVHSVLGNCKSGSEEQAASLSAGQTSSIIEINKAFYLLIGAILTFGLTLLLIVVWVILIKRRTYTSSNTTSERNVYESVDYTVEHYSSQSGVHVNSSDEGYGELSIGNTMMSMTDSNNDEEDDRPQKLLEEGGYIRNIPPPKPHYSSCTGKSRKCTGDYIVPSTPTSTFSRSPVGGHKTFDTPSHEETYSKLFV